MFGTSEPKASGMEQMVAKLIGFKPEEMQAFVVQLRDTIEGVGAALKRVEEGNARIVALLEARDNERSDGDNNGGGRNPGRGTGDGHVGQRDGATLIAPTGTGLA